MLRILCVLCTWLARGSLQSPHGVFPTACSSRNSLSIGAALVRFQCKNTVVPDWRLRTGDIRSFVRCLRRHVIAHLARSTTTSALVLCVSAAQKKDPAVVGVDKLGAALWSAFLPDPEPKLGWVTMAVSSTRLFGVTRKRLWTSEVDAVAALANGAQRSWTHIPVLQGINIDATSDDLQTLFIEPDNALLVFYTEAGRGHCVGGSETDHR